MCSGFSGEFFQCFSCRFVGRFQSIVFTICTVGVKQPFFQICKHFKDFLICHCSHFLPGFDARLGLVGWFIDGRMLLCPNGLFFPVHTHRHSSTYMVSLLSALYTDSIRLVPNRRLLLRWCIPVCILHPSGRFQSLRF